MGALRRLTARLFPALAIAGICIFCGESALRLSQVWVGRHTDTLFSVLDYDEALGWRMKPGVTERVNLVDVEGIWVAANRDGFWDREFESRKPPGTCRVVFLGDSFTWGMGVGEEERFTSIIGRDNDGWESLNFGIPAYGTDQALLAWRHVAKSYRPDVVVLTIYQNDYADNMHAVRYGRPKPYAEIVGDTVVWRNLPVDRTDFWADGIFNQAAPAYAKWFARPTERRSRIAHWLVKTSDLARLGYTLLRGRRAAGPGEQTPAGRTATEAEREQVRLLTALVRLLREEVEATGARFAAVLAGHSVPQYLLQREIFALQNLAFVEATTESIEAQLPSGSRGVYYPYSGHWTPEAHRAVADTVGRFLREAGTCDGRRLSD